MKFQLKNFMYYTLILFFCSCSSYEKFRVITEELEIPTKIFRATYSQAWQAVLQVMKKYDIEHQNQESGVLKTRWIDNTLELNFSDSFGNSDAVKAAKFKIIINITKGFSGLGKNEVTKVSIYKRQLIEQDLLQGWKEIPSDMITENVLLYRIKRLIEIDQKLQEIEKKKAEEELKALQ